MIAASRKSSVQTTGSEKSFDIVSVAIKPPNASSTAAAKVAAGTSSVGWLPKRPRAGSAIDIGALRQGFSQVRIVLSYDLIIIDIINEFSNFEIRKGKLI